MKFTDSEIKLMVASIQASKQAILQIDMEKLHSLTGRASIGATRTAWWALRKKLGLTADGHKGRRGSDLQSNNGNDDDEDGDGDEASPAAEDQEDIEPTRRTNSRGQVTLKTELEARRQAAGKRPDGRKAKALEKKKPASRKKAKDRVPRKTNKQKYVWIPPNAAGEDTDDGSEITEGDKAEIGAQAGPTNGAETRSDVGAEIRPDMGEEIIQTGETEKQQAPMQSGRPVQKRKITEEEEEAREEEEAFYEEEGFPGTADLPEAIDIQRFVKRRKKAQNTDDEETGEGAVSADSATGGAILSSETRTYADEEIERMCKLDD
ncbi:hypothetical protein MBLNU457_1498t3 [Dothideomycetes sp. NU457]